VTRSRGRTRISLRDVCVRADTARHALVGISFAAPAVADLCGQVSDSLADVRPMATEIRGLRHEVARARMASANLTAAGRAVIAAYRAGEPDPLFYLLDELASQGHDDVGESA
jgi:hypothetical protein